MLGHQLYALGIVNTPNLIFDSDAINILTEMYHDHDVSRWCSLSPLFTPPTNASSSHCPAVHSQRALQPRRDLAESALELALLGCHRKPQAVLTTKCTMRTSKRRSISSWVSPTTELSRAGGSSLAGTTRGTAQRTSRGHCTIRARIRMGYANSSTVEVAAEFWVEYSRPLLFTSLGKHFAWRMNHTLKLPGYVL